MDFSGIKEILEMVNNSDIALFDYTTNDGHLVLDKSFTRNNYKDKVVSQEANVEIKEESIENITPTKIENKAIDSLEEDDGLTIITSPMVGTFYSSPSPDSESYVKVGDNVSKDQVLCIIEAMKLMNEIQSEYSGEIKQILVKNGDMVEYGQPLFKIKEA